MRVPQRRVVERRDVPDRVRGYPEREGDGGTGEQDDCARAAQPVGERRRDAEHEQERRPLREHDVLEEVRPDEVLARERVERRDQRGDEERAPGEECRGSARLPILPCRSEVDARESDRRERLGAPRPCLRGHRRYATAVRV